MTKKFNKNLLSFPVLERVQRGPHRIYIDSEKNEYYSVTTILGAAVKDEGLEQWIKRVGESEANRIRDAAGVRGTFVHNMIEEYIFNDGKIDLSPHTKECVGMFDSLKPFLNKIDNILCLETYLHSKKDNVAGACDTIGDYEGVISIIDYKTSTRACDPTSIKIKKYFMQIAIYRSMFNELTNNTYDIQNGVILVAIPKASPQVIKVSAKSLDKYADTFRSWQREFMRKLPKI